MPVAPSLLHLYVACVLLIPGPCAHAPSTLSDFEAGSCMGGRGMLIEQKNISHEQTTPLKKSSLI